MKNNFIFLITFVFIKNVISQNINVAHHTASDRSGNIVSINSKSYYLEEITSGCCAIYANLVATDESGQIFFKSAFNFNDYNIPLKLIRTSDNCLALIGRSWNCDVGINPGYVNFIAKIDTNNVIQFQTFIQKFDTLSQNNVVLDYIKDFVQYADSSYYLVSDSLLYHYSKTGQAISVVNSGFTVLNSITALASNNLLLNGTFNGIVVNREISSSNVLINQQPSASSVITKFIQTSSGTLIGKTPNNDLVSYDTNLQAITNSTAASGVNLKFADFGIRNDSLFTTGANVLNQPFYGILDTNFILLYQFQANFKAVFPTGICLNNKNRVNIITTSASANSNISFLSLYQLPITGSLVSKQDIGVTSYSVITAGFSQPTMSGIDLNYSLKVMVRNYSADTVRSFYLNQLLQYPYNCWDLFHNSYKDTILPYDSVVVQTGTIYYGGFDTSYVISQSHNGLFYYPVCFFTTIPNSENDIEINNDTKCDSVPVPYVITGIHENKLSGQILKIYPNPSPDFLNIQFEPRVGTDGYSYSLTNSVGQVERLGEIKSQNGIVTLNIRDLKPGMYLLQVVDQGQIIRIQKVIKD